MAARTSCERWADWRTDVAIIAGSGCGRAGAQDERVRFAKRKKTPLDGIRDFHRGAPQRPPVKFHDKKI